MQHGLSTRSRVVAFITRCIPGRLAAQIAADYIAKGDLSKKALMAYDREWRASKMGKSIERNYHIKEYLIKQPDEKLNAIIHSVSSWT